MTPTRKLLYLRAFDESAVQVTRYESRNTSPRIGKPIMYQLTLTNPQEQYSGVGPPLSVINVHWSRVIHIIDRSAATGVNGSETLAVPRMRQVLNRLYDLRKLYGGASEMHWRGAFMGLSFETHPQLGGDVRVNLDHMKEMVERYYNTQQRALFTSGMSVKSVAPQFQDPTPWVDTIITAICIKIGCPKRVFMGTERGELASGQDDQAWNGRLKERQNNHITPKIIVPFIDRLIKIGVLPKPMTGYSVEWPDLDALQPLEEADLAVKQTQAMAQYVSGGVDTLVAPLDYMTKVLGFDEQEAKDMLDSTLEHLAEVQGADPTIEGDLIPGHAPPQPTPFDEDGNPIEGGPPGKKPFGGKPGGKKPPFGKEEQPTGAEEPAEESETEEPEPRGKPMK